MKQTWILIAIALIAITFTQQNEKLGTDYLYHYEESKQIGTCPAPYIEPYCSDYPRLTHYILHYFSNSVKTFVMAHMIILLLIIPYILIKLTGIQSSAIIYYSTGIWLEPQAGTIPQTFIMAILLLFIIRKDTPSRIALILIATLTHHLGAPLLLLYWTIETIKEGSWLAMAGIPHIGNLNIMHTIRAVSITNTIAIKEAWKQANKTNKTVGIITAIMAISMERIIWITQLLIAASQKRELTKIGQVYIGLWITHLIAGKYLTGTIIDWILFHIATITTIGLLIKNYKTETVKLWQETGQ